MKITIICFSQTGNTQKVALAMKEAFQKAKHTVRVLPLKGASLKEIEDCDLLGIGSPSFESQAPTPVKNFLKRLPQLKGKTAFVFATSSGVPGRTLHEMASPLRKKGAQVVGGFMARGTLHHPAPCLKGRMPDRPNADDLAQARAFAEALNCHMKSGLTGPLPESRKDALVPTWGLYQLFSLIAKPFLLRILLPKPKLDETLCDKCKLCARECPMQSISMKPYPVLGGNCIRCYHCYNACPQKAFHASWWFGNLVILSLYNVPFCRLFGEVKKGERIYK
jgi:flavodoxin